MENKMNRITNDPNYLAQFSAEKPLEEVLEEILKEVVSLENQPQHANPTAEAKLIKQPLVADRQQSKGFENLRAGVLQQQLLKASTNAMAKTAVSSAMQTRSITIQTNDKTQTADKTKSGFN